MATVTYRLNKKQREAFRLVQQNERTGHPKHISYGGARGGGKSWWARFLIDYLGSKYPGIRMLVLRNTLPELQGNYIEPLQVTLDGFATYKQQEKAFYFDNGSKLLCGYCDNIAAVKRYQGNEYDVIIFEEATNLREEWIELIEPSCRGTNGFPKIIILTTNPGGVSHNYVRRLYVDRKFKPSEHPEDYAFVQAKATDNIVLMQTQPDYIRGLDSLSPKYRAAWRDGSWDIFSGMFFEEWRDDPDHYDDHLWTHVINPFAPSPRWKYYRSFDWGYAKPFSVGWWAEDYDGVVYRIAELYGCQYENGEALPNTGLKWPTEAVFQKIRDIETQHPYLKGRRITGVADPAIWQEDGGESIAETAMKYRVYFEKGDHARIAGWMQCRNRLQFDKDGRARVYIFNTCRDFIRTIPTLQFDEHVVEDCETKLSEDHAADEFRYFCMLRKVAPLEPEEQYRPQYGADPLNQFADKRGTRK